MPRNKNNSKMKSQLPLPARSQPATRPRRPVSKKPSDNFNDAKDGPTQKKIDSSPLPDSSGSGSIDSIVLPERKLFTQKENKLRKMRTNVIGPMCTLAILQKSKVKGQGKTVRDSSPLPDSSGSDSIDSIVLPQRKLFTQKENKLRKTCTNVIGPRDTLAILQKSKVEGQGKTVIVSPKKKFGQGSSHRSKPVFPPGLLDISANKTVPNDEPLNSTPKKLLGQHDFQKPKLKYFAATSSAERAGVKNFCALTKLRMKLTFPSGSASRVILDASPTSSTTSTDFELDDWKMLPSSKMLVENLEEIPGNTPIKNLRLAKSDEQKESETGNNSTANKLQQSDKSVSSKNKSKSSHNKTKSKRNQSSAKIQAIEKSQEVAQPEETDEIHEAPNTTMDTTGQNSKKKANETNVRSPEAMLHSKTNWNDSFKDQGRNTSVSETESLMRPEIRPKMEPIRESVGSTDSSAQGSGWDSHIVTRKTMRQKFGKEFTPQMSLHGMVMEKSAKWQTIHTDSIIVPQANSTEIGNEISVPDMEYHHAPESSATDRKDTYDRDCAARSDCASDLDMSGKKENNIHEHLQKLKQISIEQNKQMAEKVRRHYREPDMALINQYTYLPSDLLMSHASPKVTKPPEPKPRKPSGVSLGALPKVTLEELKYKPPRRLVPRNASWASMRLYKFLENKLEPKYDFMARVRAEKLVEYINRFCEETRWLTVAPLGAINELKREMARLEIVKTHFEFYQFFHDYMPRELRIKVNPDIVNKLPLPRNGVFSDIFE